MTKGCIPSWSYALVCELAQSEMCAPSWEAEFTDKIAIRMSHNTTDSFREMVGVACSRYGEAAWKDSLDQCALFENILPAVMKRLQHLNIYVHFKCNRTFVHVLEMHKLLNLQAVNSPHQTLVIGGCHGAAAACKYIWPNTALHKTLDLSKGNGTVTLTACLKEWQDKECTAQKYDMVICVGICDYSNDHRAAEHRNMHCMLLQISSALARLEVRGSILCKMSGLYLHITKQLISNLSTYFESCYICKPSCSRPTNSETFVFLKSVLPDTLPGVVKHIDGVLHQWNELQRDAGVCLTNLSGANVHPDLDVYARAMQTAQTQAAGSHTPVPRSVLAPAGRSPRWHR